ncbi:hypothetical protein HDE76_000039 [Rhodanobacter sp. ANJX3]|uniref:hypothetical protein n=1 Tax=Rhodanobacter sp. ANJX3 TaxID=2723083 RepID=UPI00160E55F6|nr:hypothetical protein [Rhodanobacter sp. ANJX3]MBB5356857.1 hypothetical protein [Rhodanobacter sp. ANJX3]
MEAELFKRELSNSEIYDKSLLAYASGGLGLSLTFIKDIFPLSTATYTSCLEVSWIAWAVTIVIVLGSFLLSQKAITLQLALGHQYYIQNIDAAFDKKNRYSIATRWASYASGITFLAGVILTIIFVWVNVATKVSIPSVTETLTVKTPTTSGPKHAMDGAPIPTIQKVIPAKPAPAPAPPAKPPAPTPKK